MLRTHVESSSIVSVGYDEERRVLEVMYTGGRVYHYLNVPSALVLALLEAKSKGRFLNDQIKPNFDYRAV
jgi:hypothetical protein